MKKKLFLNFRSFFNTINSIFEIEYLTDIDNGSIIVKPKIQITPVVQKRFNISNKDFDNKKEIEQAVIKLKDKFPQNRYNYISYDIEFLNFLNIEINDFKKKEKIIYPFQEKKYFKNVKKLSKYYHNINNYYKEWEENNNDLKILHSDEITLEKENTGLSKKDNFKINIDKIFDKDGTLYNLEKFDYRKQQDILAKKINKNFIENRKLMVNAPTGIGKTLAYLFNAIKFAYSENKKVVISTFTKKLQNQIRDKDLPFIEKFLNKKINVVFLKGISNYVCYKSFKSFIKDLTIPKVIREYVYNMYVNYSIYEIESYNIKNEYKEMLELDICKKYKCNYLKECVYWQLREKAKKTNILVLNHAFLVNELKYNGLKDYDYLIVDEAHHLENILNKELGGELARSQFDFLKVIKRYKIKKIINKWHKMFDRLDKTKYSEVKMLIDDLKIVAEYGDEFIKEKIDQSIYNIKKYFKFNDSYYIDNIYKNDEIIYKMYPYSIDKWVKKNIWEKFNSTVFMSGTLFLDKKIFLNIFKKIYGLYDKKTEFIKLKSPFNFKKNVKFFIPVDFPSYNYENKSDYFDAVIAFLKEYVKRTEGKLLVLFTSYEDMFHVRDEMIDFFKKNGINLYINEFEEKKIKNDIFYTVFGTYSMWEGVDIDNKYLNSLIMIKSPFSVPNDGYFMSKKKILNDNMYYFFYLNNAIVKFRQGFGRLIRSKNDKGIFILLDNRLTKKSYKKFFLNSIEKNMPVNFVPTRDIFNLSEVFLFDKSGLFLKNYVKRKNTYKFLDHKQVFISRDGQKGIKIIYGAAGTGKTVILIHRIKFLLMNFPHINNILFVTYTASLSRYIQNVLNLEGINIESKQITVDYFYRFCKKKYRKKDKDENFNDFYKKTYKYTNQNQEELEKYDAIFIDEGQDFGKLEYKVIFNFLKKRNSDLNVAIDDKQDIYQMDFQKFFKKREVKKYYLKKPYRNSLYIMKFANLIIRNLFYSDLDYHFNKGQKPILKKYNNKNEILKGVKKYIDNLRKKEFNLNQIAIVYPRKNIYNNFINDLENFLNKKNINHKNISHYKNKSNYLILDKNLKISTIHSVKGLEFKSVIILGIDELKISNKNKRLLYVAITRAKEKLFLPYLKNSGFISYLGIGN